MVKYSTNQGALPAEFSVRLLQRICSVIPEQHRLLSALQKGRTCKLYGTRCIIWSLEAFFLSGHFGTRLYNSANKYFIYISLAICCIYQLL